MGTDRPGPGLTTTRPEISGVPGAEHAEYTRPEGGAMPRYEYRCEQADRTVEVEHAMSERLTTWGEVCDRAGIGLGGASADAPVEKLISLPAIGGAKPEQGPGPCGAGCGCHPGG